MKKENNEDEQRIFEEEMMKIEEKMYKGEYEFTDKEFTGLSLEQQRIIDTQIFGELSVDEEDTELLTAGEEEKIKLKKFREAVLAYKRESKGFFVGEFLGQCQKKRRVGDKWYPWTKEMLERVDSNEAVMRSVLLEHGHERVGQLMGEGKDNGWNSTLEEKVKELIDGLKSIERTIKGDGLNTIWGMVKSNGIILNRIKSSRSSFMKIPNRKYDIIDYVKYRIEQWTTHYERLKAEKKKRDLYFK